MRKLVVSVSVLTFILIVQLAAFVNCGGMTPYSASSTGAPNVTSPLNLGSTLSNVMPVTVGNCGTDGYINEPCVSVTVCSPGTDSCVVIPDILLDTGSYGLRVFGSTVSALSLSQIKSSTGFPVLECAQFGSGSTWGPVQSADVGLGGEPRIKVPIQVIDSTYQVPTGSAACTDLMTSPSVSGFNGILGVGVLLYDCGAYCVTYPNLNIYFSCSSNSNCVSTALPLSSQVVNPVGLLPVDNNGVILSFPSISSSGVLSTTGTMTLGIGTNLNNSPGNVNVFTADENANFTTTYNGVTDDESFIDSGSNALYFPDSGITDCTDAPGFYCPPKTLSLSAIQKSQGSSTSLSVAFSVGNTDDLLNHFSASNGVLNNLGGSGSALQFDWGFPFFLGRTVLVGLETKSSSAGSGSYWAY